MRRIFHPVGQGAFFSEHFEEAKKPYSIVYDCGSLTLDVKEMRTKVNSSFRENEVIDVLFISHFHADHINGLDFLKKQCKIKNVVIPYLNDDIRTLTRIANYASTGSTDTRLVDDVETFFGDGTRVFQVLEANTDGERNEDQRNEPVSLDPDDNRERVAGVTSASPGAGRTIASGTRLTSKEIPFWVFIPYNFKMTERVAVFEAELAKYGLKLSDLQSIEDIKRHESAVITAYKAVNSDLNRNTMFLYSGPKDASTFPVMYQLMPENFQYWPPYREFHRLQPGCLYTGDADLKERGLLKFLKPAIIPYERAIGTCVIPHHGAINNYRDGIWEFLGATRTCILNYGTDNTYGHPSDAVIADILTNSRCMVRVTEERNTIAVFKTSFK